MRPRRNTSLQAEDLPSGETVIVRPDDGKAVVLNAKGGVVWELCDGNREIAEIAAFICGSVPGAPLDQVTRDVGDLARQLAAEGLVEDAELCGKPLSAR